ncbi:MAG: hypothetical protein COV30_02210 [Candidatus Yanofskybacteria bacterium CG10_big_fil_rev_8_21_14_0_10_37_15]|uniref:Serine protease n=1 Tax=Candidatus Yanofskybacteria bacterium CG10_big_fil_rev_8_21_14_0_10_37_15 TaxID=1975097 RepID=A0A2H0R5B5_9BACT|nr:MAG: hypothetical protein COV30_02210 [Candidatus Yanofskybacteria bacterium CG10_big_fil_rev_8_21_14_0_10_37_15]
MKTSFRFLVLSLCIFYLSCDLKYNTSEGEGDCRYGDLLAQDFKTDVAWIVMEWNCKPSGYGSGFLVDKENGLFYTNKHVSDMFNSFGRGSHKIYFNGRFYNAKVVKVPPLRDAALVRITDSFDFSNFPEPAPFAKESAKIGDEVFVEGFHPHPYLLIESNKNNNYDEKITTIWEKYYNLHTFNLNVKKEVVLEKFKGKIVKFDFPAKTQIGLFVTDQVKAWTTYSMAESDKDHGFSFGGLSGTVVRNSRGETVGIFTIELREEFEKGEKTGDVQFIERVHKTFGFTPIELIADLKQYFNEK